MKHTPLNRLTDQQKRMIYAAPELFEALMDLVDQLQERNLAADFQLDKAHSAIMKVVDARKDEQ